MKPGGVLVMTLSHEPTPPGMQMHSTSTVEIEGLVRAHGLEVLRVTTSSDQGASADVTWDVMARRLPDDGTGALPLVRGIVLSDDKSSTYKLAPLRAVARIEEYAPAAATPASDGRDAIEVPLGRNLAANPRRDPDPQSTSWHPRRDVRGTMDATCRRPIDGASCRTGRWRG